MNVTTVTQFLRDMPEIIKQHICTLSADYTRARKRHNELSRAYYVLLGVTSLLEKHLAPDVQRKVIRRLVDDPQFRDAVDAAAKINHEAVAKLLCDQVEPC